METDIELATILSGLTFAMVFIGLGLSAIASMIDMFKFAYGAFVLLGTTRRSSALLDEEAIRRFYANTIVRCSALATMGRQLPKPQ